MYILWLVYISILITEHLLSKFYSHLVQIQHVLDFLEKPSEPSVKPGYRISGTKLMDQTPIRKGRPHINTETSFSSMTSNPAQLNEMFKLSCCSLHPTCCLPFADYLLLLAKKTCYSAFLAVIFVFHLGIFQHKTTDTSYTTS